MERDRRGTEKGIEDGCRYRYEFKDKQRGRWTGTDREQIEDQMVILPHMLRYNRLLHHPPLVGMSVLL